MEFKFKFVGSKPTLFTPTTEVLMPWPKKLRLVLKSMRWIFLLWSTRLKRTLIVWQNRWYLGSETSGDFSVNEVLTGSEAFGYHQASFFRSNLTCFCRPGTAQLDTVSMTDIFKKGENHFPCDFHTRIFVYLWSFDYLSKKRVDVLIRTLYQIDGRFRYFSSSSSYLEVFEYSLKSFERTQPSRVIRHHSVGELRTCNHTRL